MKNNVLIYSIVVDENRDGPSDTIEKRIKNVKI